MNKSSARLIYLAAVLFALLALSACQSQGIPASALLTPVHLRTQPTATLEPTFTATTLPTETPIPATATLAVNPTAAATIIVPSATLPSVSIPDKYTYISQSPADGTVFTPGQTFTTTWTVKNVGTTTWTTAYMLRFYAGSRLGATDIKFPKEVKPNETVDLTVNMTAPITPGEYTSTWVLSNKDLLNYGSGVYVLIKVGNATATPITPATEVPTATSEAPTATSEPTTAPTTAVTP